jgi:hypothetical protein
MVLWATDVRDCSTTCIVAGAGTAN